MSQARLMDGTALARRIVEETAKRAADLTGRTGRAPCLATVLVGEDPASVTYVRMKRNRCRAAGIESRHVELPAATTTEELVVALRALSDDPTVHGILLQHPMGPHIDERAAFEAIAPEKDVDGVTFASFATMSFGLPGFVSCTPAGSCGCSTRTTSTRQESGPWSWAAARSSASRPACCCSPGTPR
jgi:methylenetetrahydrofolate dehydrogenase (NADP+)/methenyltetrahydrofolate cyclohydrolase